MKHLFASILLAAAGVSHAQTAPAPPTVGPADLGSAAGSWAKWGVFPTGASWLGYTYTRNGVRRLVVICRLPGFVPVKVNTDGMTPIAAARAEWVANVRSDCRTDPALRPLWLAAKEAFRE